MTIEVDGTVTSKDGINTLIGNRSECIDGGGTWRAGEIVQAPEVCSYSRTKCDGGEQCHGSVAPDNIVPDEFNAFIAMTQALILIAATARAQENVNYLTFTSKLLASL